MTWWHGGPRIRGQLILPASETGVEPLCSWAAMDGIDISHVRTDRVYVSVDRGWAEFYAAWHPEGAWVYEVKPIGELVDDPDWRDPPPGHPIGVPGQPNPSRMCERALIVRRFTVSRARRAQLQAGTLRPFSTISGGPA